MSLLLSHHHHLHLSSATHDPGPAMTSSKIVRVKIRSPPASSFSSAPSSKGSGASHKTASSHCSKCTHCKARDGESQGATKSCLKPAIAPSPDYHIPASRQPHPPMDPRMHDFQAPSFHGPSYIPHAQASHPISMPLGMGLGMGMPAPVPMGMPVHLPHESRLHPYAPAPVLHHLGRGPEPLFGWDSVMPLNHTYGQPRYMRRTKPDYRRFCFSVGKADVPYAAMPGGPLWGMDVTMAPQMVGGHRW